MEGELKNSSEIYKSKPKFFGERAERINKEEYEQIVQEIIDLAGDGFDELRPTTQLSDKESFGDVDMVCLPQRNIDRLYFQQVFGDKMLDYNRTGHVHSTLLALNTKTVQVDFIQAKNKEDFDCKFTYYSKGHLSSVIGMIARKLDFKYGTEGFFKRFKDKRGNWHDIFISESLDDGLKILGLNKDQYAEINTTEEIIEFVSRSPLFDSSYFQYSNLNRRDKSAVKRSQQEEYIVSQLVAKGKARTISENDELFKEYFPNEYARYQEEAERIEKETYRQGAIGGLMVMEAFNLKPGPKVGRALKYISDNYSNATQLSDEMISEIKEKVLND